jgi:competence factor transport accessory protein ComB
MFDTKQLESAEFYQRRYANFTTQIIVPLFLGLIAVIVFGFFTHRELTVKAAGQVLPRTTLVTIQSTSNNAIDMNKLQEGKLVHAGDLLVKYQDTEGKANQAVLNQQIQEDKDQLSVLKTYQQSVESGQSQFATSDQNQSDRNQANNQAEQQKSIMAKSKSDLTSKISDYHAIVKAISQDNANVAKGNQFQYLYDNYATQLKNLDSNSAKDQLRAQAIADVQSQIQSLKDNVSTYNDQIASIMTQRALSSSETQHEISSLKSKTLADIDSQLTKVQDNLTQLEANQQTNQDTLADSRLIAPQTGVLHVMPNTKKVKYLAKGTAIAQISPELTNQTLLSVQFELPATKISGVKVGQRVRYRISQNISKPVVLTGVIKQIDVTPTSTKNGNFFEITANLRATSKQYQQLRYGLEGQVIVITGEKTWVKYIWDNIAGD